MIYKVLRFLSFLLCKLLFRLEIKGRNNIPRTGGFIVASNHVSYLDPIILGIACPRELNFMARHDLFTIPFLGTLLRNVRAFPLRRSFADLTSIKEALRRLHQAGGLVLFPTGTRFSEGKDNDVQPGIGFMTAKAGVPVVPAFINGTHKALSRYARFIKPHKVRVYFGRPIYPTGSMSPGGKNNGIYLKDSNLKKDYNDFACSIMQEIRLLGEVGKLHNVE
jgi:1-acyl-sn-glycerol-3-phosphate acyltransferase